MNEESLFNEAAGKKSQARAAFLDEHCKHNVALRKRLEALLRANDHPDPFLEAPAPIAGTTLDETTLERPGTHIGSYKLIEQIGEGGMGLVFMAEQKEPIRRKVALKLIKPGMDSKQVIARFNAERQALALMDHPNIAKILDAGTTGESPRDSTGEPSRLSDRFSPADGSSGRPYFVMELIHGIPITDYCDRAKFTIRKRLELFVQVCRAVQHAHTKGIIHRDLKPGNVLVTSNDVDAVPKIIDFGVAKALDQSLTEHTLDTGFAQMLGTPLYMSPEQAEFNQTGVDTRSDIYSLGVLLYELLTGTTPVDKERLRQSAYGEIRRLIREEEPPKPSTRISTLNQQAGSTLSAQRQSNPQQLCLLLRGELDWIVMKALEKDRNRRYESASTLAADVQRYLQDEPVQACPPSHRYLLGKFLRKYRRGVLTATTLLFAAVFLGAGAGWVVLDRSARRAETERQRVAAEQTVAEHLHHAKIWRDQERWTEALQALDRASVRLEESGLQALQEHVEKRRREVALVVRLEEAQRKSRDFARETRDYAGADRAYQGAFAEYGLDLARLPAEEIAGQIRNSAIRTQLVTALDYWAYVRGRLPKGDAEALRAIARLADDDGDRWRQQLRDARVVNDKATLEAMAEQESVLAQPPANLLIMSGLLAEANAPAARLRLLRRAQERYYADFWMNLELAKALYYENGFETNPTALAESIGFFRAALALHPENPVAHSMLGAVLHLQQKLPEAAAAQRKAIEFNPDGPVAYFLLGKVLLDQEKLPEAIDICLKAEGLFRKAIEIDPFNIDALYCGACAMALCSEGKDGANVDAKERTRLRGQALSWLRAALSTTQRLFEKDPDKEGPAVRRKMQYWQQDSDFSGVRGDAVLAKLPEAECQVWQNLWKEVAELERRAAVSQPR